MEFNMNAINPQWIMARRRAARRAAQFSQPHMSYPAITRRELADTGPKVKIGILRDPALPIEIHPAIHTPPTRGWAWQEHATMAVCGVSLVAIASILSLGY